MKIHFYAKKKIYSKSLTIHSSYDVIHFFDMCDHKACLHISIA